MTPIPDDIVELCAKAIAWRELTDLGRKQCDWETAFSEAEKNEYRGIVRTVLGVASHGMVMVPREPTKEMIEAAFHDYMEYERQGPTKPSWNCLTMWEAMIAASPHKEGK